MRLDVHIGLHKTASTSFQEFLYINKNELSNVGVLYPDEDINKMRNEPIYNKNDLVNLLNDDYNNKKENVTLNNYLKKLKNFIEK